MRAYAYMSFMDVAINRHQKAELYNCYRWVLKRMSKEKSVTVQILVFGQNWRGCFFSNSGLFIAVAGCLLCTSWLHMAVYILVIGGIQLLQRSIIARRRDKKESELLWEIGTAETEITYKGTAKIKGQDMKVRTAQRMLIPKGDIVMVTTLDGFKPYVESMTGSQIIIPGSKPAYRKENISSI